MRANSSSATHPTRPSATALHQLIVPQPYPLPPNHHPIPLRVNSWPTPSSPAPTNPRPPPPLCRIMPPMKRPWPVTAIAWLLLLQCAGLVGLGALALRPYLPNWSLALEQAAGLRLAPLSGLLFACLALLALTAAFGFFRQARGAWVSAVLVQGLTLLSALLLYFRGRPAYVYVLMVYGLFMVLYLHQADVQAAFRREINPRPATQGQIKP